MSNKARKFKRQWIVTAEGKSRGIEGELTFVEQTFEDIIYSLAHNVGILAQDTKVTVTGKDLIEVE